VSVVAVGVSHRSAPVAVRERVQLDEARAAEVLAALVEEPGVDEAAALFTCNRSELYLAGSDAAAAAEAATAALAGAPALEAWHDAAAARHLFRVAAGLESMVLGEPEIQGQVRRAFGRALALGTTGRVLNRLFQDALGAGKRVRSATGISRGGASVASVAMALAARELGELAGRRALVVGAGKHGALTARALADAGVRTMFVANRDRGRAAELARRFGGAAVGLGDLGQELRRCELVVTCTSAPERVLTRRDLAAASEGRRLVVLDTAVPRDVEPAAASLPGVALFDLDDIGREVARTLAARRGEADRAAPIVEREVARFERWLSADPQAHLSVP
jgi:glutamyl-tRNA reductase